MLNFPFHVGYTLLTTWAGYALQGGQSWVAVAFAFGICNFGSAPISSIALTYMTDAYNEVRSGLVPRATEDGADRVMRRSLAMLW